MVVTRKTAATVMPPTSRTNSSQGTLRARSKPPQKSALAPTDDPDDGRPPRDADSHIPDTEQSPKKQPQKLKGRKQHNRRRKRSTTLVDLLARIFLLFFTIYSLAVCPTDTHLQSPICRGLTEYRRLILDPYLLPPLRIALAHPAIAPVLAYVQPAYTTTLRVATPVARRTSVAWSTYVVPQWHKRMVPAYNARLRPHLYRLRLRVAPYTAVVAKQYTRFVSPAVAHAANLTRRAQPHVILAAARTYDAYVVARPHVVRAAAQLRHIPPFVVKHVLTPLARARRQFVDPHVARMLAKVQELGRGNNSGNGTEPATPVYSTQVVDSVPVVSVEVPEPSAASIVAASKHLGDVDVTAIPPDVTVSEAIESVATAAEDTATHVLETASSVALSASEPVTSVINTVSSLIAETASAITSSASSAVQSASTFVAESASIAAEPVIATTTSASSSASSVLAEASGAAEDVNIPAPPSGAAVPSTAPIADDGDVVASSLPTPPAEDIAADIGIDLDAFVAELGLDADADPSTPSPSRAGDGEASPAASSVPIPELSDAERAERAAAKAADTAAKRAALEARTARWEADLQALAARQRKALRRALVGMRKERVAALREDGPLRRAVEGLHGAAETALRGTEAYLGKLRREARGKAESAALWERVLEKVEAKFAKGVEAVEGEVNAWWEEGREQELRIVDELAAEVNSLGGDAQADIGLDYAWLDDVSYMDWQRYHALLDVHKEFVETAKTIQDGTHASPPVNPVDTALNELESEVRDLVVGFETRLRRVRREGERAFGSLDASPDADEAEDGEGGGEGDQVRIQPVPDKAAEGLVEPVFIGRGQEEVLSALEHAPPAETAASAESTPCRRCEGAKERGELPEAPAGHVHGEL